MKIVRYRRISDGWGITIHRALAQLAGIRPGDFVQIAPATDDKDEPCLVVKFVSHDWRAVADAEGGERQSVKE